MKLFGRRNAAEKSPDRGKRAGYAYLDEVTSEAAPGANSVTEQEITSLGDERLAEWLGLKERADRAENEVTYFTCLKTLSEMIAKMPVKGYKSTANGVEEISAGSDPMLYLLKVRPNPYMTPTVFFNTIEVNRNHYGNGFFYIEREFKRSRFGGSIVPVGLWVMPSDCVQIIVDDAGIFGGKGRLYYRYTDRVSAAEYIFDSDDVFHVKTSFSFDGVTGMPVRDILKMTVDCAAQSQHVMTELYKSGLSSKAVLEYTGELSPAKQKKLQKTFEDLGSGALNAGRVLPVPLGMKLTPLNIKLQDAQFIESRKYTAVQLAGAFGIKPNQINDYEKSSYANSEAQNLSFLVDTALFIIKQYEDELNYKCRSAEAEAAGVYYKFNEKVLLRTDTKTQMETLATGVNNGIYKPNEARRKLDMSDSDGGDRLIVNGNYIPLENVGAQYGMADAAADKERNQE